MLFEFDTGLFADSVESFPGSLDSQAIFACGTYQLEEDASGQGTIHRQERRGKLYLFKAPFGKPEESHVFESWDLTGILDMKWSHSLTSTRNDEYPCYLVLAQANGLISFFRWNEEVNRLEYCSDLTVEPDRSKIQLSCDLPSRHGGDHGRVFTSTNLGGLEFHRWDNGCVELESSILKAHDYECWTVACNPEGPDNLLASGGDDCLLKLWDLRMDPQNSLTIKKWHTMGVTSITYHPTKEHIFVSGSYDENIRLWDERNLKMPISSVKMAGGIWRLKWAPNCQDTLLAACMNDGFHVVDINKEKVLCSNREHESLAYGADWIYDGENPGLVATCSFYDHLLTIWDAGNIL